MARKKHSSATHHRGKHHGGHHGAHDMRHGGTHGHVYHSGSHHSGGSGRKHRGHHGTGDTLHDDMHSSLAGYSHGGKDPHIDAAHHAANKAHGMGAGLAPTGDYGAAGHGNCSEIGGDENAEYYGH